MADTRRHFLSTVMDGLARSDGFTIALAARAAFVEVSKCELRTKEQHDDY
jgi:hypothetical protein